MAQIISGYGLETNEGRVYFAFEGDDFDPNEMTQFLGIDPTSFVLKGSRIPGKLPKMTRWYLSTENVVNDYIDVYEMTTEIVKQLKPKTDLIIQAKQRFNVAPRFEVVLKLSMKEEHSTPAIGFEVETVEFLGEIGAYIDIDTYMI